MVRRTDQAAVATRKSGNAFRFRRNSRHIPRAQCFRICVIHYRLPSHPCSLRGMIRTWPFYDDWPAPFCVKHVLHDLNKIPTENPAIPQAIARKTEVPLFGARCCRYARRMKRTVRLPDYARGKYLRRSIFYYLFDLFSVNSIWTKSSCPLTNYVWVVFSHGISFPFKYYQLLY